MTFDWVYSNKCSDCSDCLSNGYWCSVEFKGCVKWGENFRFILCAFSHSSTVSLQGWAKEMELSWEKVSARLQPATAGLARLVLSKQLEQIYNSLYVKEGTTWKANLYHLRRNISTTQKRGKNPKAICQFCLWARMETAGWHLAVATTLLKRRSGRPYMTSAEKGRWGSRNAANLQTNSKDFADKEGGGG